MRRHGRTIAFALIPILSFLLPLGAWGQQQSPWTWKDREGKIRSRADLDQILAQHKLWLEPGSRLGTKADLSCMDLHGADLHGADLRCADLHGADLRDADLSEANLSCEYPYFTLLSNADLRGARLINTDMSDADLTGADVTGAVFEPKSQPAVDMALAQGLYSMTYRNWPGPLNLLRKQFQDSGYREAEREITYALTSEEIRRKQFIESWFYRIFFDWTCRYGLTPLRPLFIVVWLWSVCVVVYALFMHAPGPSGVYFVGTRSWRGMTCSQGLRIRRRRVRLQEKWRIPLTFLREEWRLLRTSMLFSLMSAFNISVEGINFGRWLRMLARREYELKPVGWARTASGLQSILTFCLLALFVLTYIRAQMITP